MYCAGVRGKTTQEHHHQLFKTKVPFLLHKPDTSSIKAFPSFHTLLFDRCLSCISFQERFPEKLAVALSLTSTYSYSKKSLTRTSPFCICNNQLYPMQKCSLYKHFVSCPVLVHHVTFLKPIF